MRVAVVTGAARGIGAAAVKEFAVRGWSVVAVDRCSDDPRLPYRLGTEAELREVVDEASQNGHAVPFIGDASSPDSMTDAMQAAETEFGAVHAVVAVAGAIAGGTPAWEMPLEEQEAMLDINLGSVLIAARTGIPAILRGTPPRHGRFIAVSSAAATRALPMLAAYCAAKAGVNAFVRTLAVELAGTGVTANAVNPGSTATAILDESARIYGLDAATTFASQQPLGRLIEPAEVARTLVWVATDDTDAITGATIAVDGGLSL